VHLLVKGILINNNLLGLPQTRCNFIHLPQAGTEVEVTKCATQAWYNFPIIYGS